MESELNLIILDKHQIFREGVKQVLEKEPTFHIMVSSDDYSLLQSSIEEYTIDVLLLDVHMFAEHEAHITDIIEKYDTKVIVISSKEDKKFVAEAMKAGVYGYLLKEMDIYSFIEAIKLVGTGFSYIHPFASDELVKEYRKLMQEESKVMKPLHLFTKRECEVLQLLADGKSNRQMAEVLDISEKTVKNHVSNLFKKMKVNDRTSAVVIAIRNLWVELT